jgi:hypothetical protein
MIHVYAALLMRRPFTTARNYIFASATRRQTAYSEWPYKPNPQHQPAWPTRYDRNRSEHQARSRSEWPFGLLPIETKAAQQVYPRSNDSAIAGTNDPNDE